MSCFWPIKGYDGGKKPNGKINIVFKRNKSQKGEEIYLPCGSCDGCKLERARQWAVRCLHEASLYKNNCFVTLTYDDDNLPDNLSLDVEEWQKFMKRLRKQYGEGIKFFHCGEYGKKFGRPHYHGLLFNHDFEDKVLYKEENGNRLYVSEDLNRLWKKGFTTVGDVTMQSAGYVARYTLKKANKKEQEIEDSNGLLPYERFNIESGEVWKVNPEYVTMSRGGRTKKGGIGHGWFMKYKTDVFPSDEVIIKGKRMKPPRYYDSLLEKVDPGMFERLKEERQKKSEKLVDVGNGILVNDYTDAWRCEVRETTMKKKLEKLIRPMENET